MKKISDIIDFNSDNLSEMILPHIWGNYTKDKEGCQETYSVIVYGINEVISDFMSKQLDIGSADVGLLMKIVADLLDEWSIPILVKLHILSLFYITINTTISNLHQLYNDIELTDNEKVFYSGQQRDLN